MTALDALVACRRAWEATQPQLTISGWADELDRLDVKRADRDGCCVESVEPASRRPPLAADGGLAQNYYGPDALSVEGQRRGQGGEL